MSRPTDWKEGRYYYGKSFLWNLFHYKSVDYGRIVNEGENDRIEDIMFIRMMCIFVACIVIPITLRLLIQ